MQMWGPKREEKWDKLFVLHAILNYIKKGGEEACDLGIYYVIKCFDSMWNQECLNNLLIAGCQDDRMHILQKEINMLRLQLKLQKETPKEWAFKI